MTNDELAKRMESVFMELCALGMMRRTGEGRFSLTEGGERCIRQQQSVLGTSESEERCPECGKRLEPSGIGGGSWVCVNEECRWVEGGTGCGACHGNGCPKCAPVDSPRGRCQRCNRPIMADDFTPVEARICLDCLP